jgi:fatty-acyl-CoA synthase
VGQAFVVAHPHASLDPDAVRAWARERLAGYKVPRHLTPLPALPRLGSGKVDRAALLQLATAGR